MWIRHASQPLTEQVQGLLTMSQGRTYYHVIVPSPGAGDAGEKVIVSADSHEVNTTLGDPDLVLFLDEAEVARFARVLSWWAVQG